MNTKMTDLVTCQISGTIGGVAVATMTQHGMGQHVVLISAAEFEEYLRVRYWSR